MQKEKKLQSQYKHMNHYMYFPNYNAAKFGIDGVKDYQNGNFDNTLKNGVNYLIPLGMRKIGIPL
jgi:hypothetical protein